MTRGAAFAALAAALLAACSGERDEPGGVTADDARQLNEAAAMLDANSVDADALDNAGAPR
jgi:outer membrane biogenesis lipoprotein LolB